MNLYSYNSLYNTPSSSSSSNISSSSSIIPTTASIGNNDVVSWSPHTSSRFIVISNRDIHSYKVKEELFKKAVENDFGDIAEMSSMKQQQEIYFQHCCTTTLPYPIKCHAWSTDHRDIVALGLSNGTISFNNTRSSKIVAEFIPRSLRLCKSISWNQMQTNLIAAGFDKTKTDGGVVIWDVNNLALDATKSTQNGTKYLPERIDKPLYEVGLSDTATSVCWIPGQRLSFAMGTSLRYIRIFDLREYANLKSTRPSLNFVAHNKSVLGICFNPFDTTQFASYSDDGQVKLWDIRKTTNPVGRELSGPMKTDATISHIEFSSRNRNILGILVRDGTLLRFWDTSQPGTEKSVKFKIAPYKSLYFDEDPISSFSFNPIIADCTLVSSFTGKIKCLFAKEHPKISISPRGNIAYSHGNIFIERELPHNADCGSSCVMKTRAHKSIGMDFTRNLEIANEMNELDMIELWSWTNRIKMLNEDSTRKIHPSQYNYIGIKRLLSEDLDSPVPFKLPPSTFISSKFASIPSLSSSSSGNSSPTTSTEKFETQMPISKLFPSLKVYSDTRRSLVVELCGWNEELLRRINLCLNNELSEESDQEKIKKQYLNERSVAIAIFAMDLNLAAKLLIAIENNDDKLRQNNNNNYKFLAYALGGFSEERQKEFKDVYTSLYSIHTNAYLRAALGFLSEISSTCEYTTVLNERGISLSDRLAFAAIYLPEENLITYVNKMTEEVIQRGNLQGILLTGLNRDAVELMQNYVDRSGDIQIACLLLKNVVPTQFEEKRVDMWLYNYREMLDQWQMWESRAFLDIKLTQYSSEKISARSAPEVSVKCTFCNQALVHKTLSSNKMAQVTNFNAKIGGSGNYATRYKPTSCPNCHRPLPRCSICLMPFGSPSHSMGGTSFPTVADDSNQYGQLDYCFAWCTKCRHGGHVKHLMEWFSNHHACAVSGCECGCMPCSNNIHNSNSCR